MYISDSDKDKVLSLTNDRYLETIEAFGPLKKSGASYTTRCPVCDSENSLSINPSKHIFKCFKCGQITGKSSVAYLMSGHNMAFNDALEWLANHYGINITIKHPTPVTSAKAKRKRESFCKRMLADSGLDTKDITATVFDREKHKTTFQKATFYPGSIDKRGEIDKDGDDVIIMYYDLDGYPVTYQPRNAKGGFDEEEKPYFRVRWQYPEEHKGKDGRPAKYRTPAGATSHIYIPQLIRDLYRKKEQITRLYIQEGEKKAEKACKHGIPSVAISGIQNLGQNKQLPECIVKLVEECDVREVVFILDSDCFDLSEHIKINDPIEKRPRNFYYAIKNYQEYMVTLKNRNRYVEIYFGHVIKNEKGDKGIDDLLTNTLKGKEHLLKEDIDTAINEKVKTGKYVQLYKITTYTEEKLKEIWGLHSAKVFCAKYFEQLKSLPEFVFGRNRWRFNDKKELESAQPLDYSEQFWEETIETTKAGKTKSKYEFRYVPFIQFLSNRGFGMYPKLEDKKFYFIHINYPFVKEVDVPDIREFVKEFTTGNLKEGVMEMLMRGGPQYIGPSTLAYLKTLHPIWEVPQRNSQYLYFQDTFWHISSNKITESTYNQIPHYIWEEQKKQFPATLTSPLFHVNYDPANETWSYSLTELGKKCDFLRFLENTSNFTWRKNSDEVTPQERNENAQHFLAKLSSLGYLCTSVKDYSVAKAVVAVDGKQSEIGISNGRSGKSLIGELLKRTVITQYLNGKTIDLSRDQFVWTELTNKTKLVFIDDVRKDFDFELLFANITGSWTINYKSGGRVTLDFATSPKVYITTNHSISGDGSSFTDRQWNVAFSDFYSDTHKPSDDFGSRFFDEWDHEQWNLVWNMISQAVQLFFKYGIIESPSERIETRKLRQDLGEEFILWADEYFSSSEHLNCRITRKDMYDNLLKNVGTGREKFYTPTIFKKKVVKYCKFRDLWFNPHKYNYLTDTAAKLDKDGRPELDDKSGGVEWFIIGEQCFYDIASPATFSDSDKEDDDKYDLFNREYNED